MIARARPARSFTVNRKTLSRGRNPRRSVAGVRMQASMFNVRVPLEASGDVFLMNTFTDAQLIVSRDVVDLIDRVDDAWDFSEVERATIAQLTEHGFVVQDRESERDELKGFFRDVH